MMFLLKRRAQYGNNWSVSLQFFRWLLLYLICTYYRLDLSFLFGNVGFPKRSPVYEKIVSLSFIASATDCSFDAICHYLKLKMIFIYGNDVSLETVCPLWKQLVGQLIVFPIVVVVLYLLILLVENIVHIWVVGFPKCSSGYEKIASQFYSFCRGLFFDATCHYLKLKTIFIYGNDVSLETSCTIWKQLVGQLIAFPIVVFVPYLLILHVENIVHIGVVAFPKCSSGYEKIASLSFIASATGCSFDAICRYLKLKTFFIYGNDVSLETACPIWKQLVSQLSFSDGCFCT